MCKKNLAHLFFMSYRFLIDLKSDFLSDFLFVFPTYLLHDSEESQNIVQVGYHQQ